MEEKIKAKIEELSKTKESVMAQLNAIIGAESVLLELLKKEWYIWKLFCRLFLMDKH